MSKNFIFFFETRTRRLGESESMPNFVLAGLASLAATRPEGTSKGVWLGPGELGSVEPKASALIDF